MAGSGEEVGQCQVGGLFLLACWEHVLHSALQQSGP